MLNLGVVDLDESLFSDEILYEGDGSGLASVASVSLEGESEDGDALLQGVLGAQ